MQFEALAPHFWAAMLRTLRKLTRLAVTALVLAVGLGAVATPPTTTALRPAVVTSRVAELRVDRSPVSERAGHAPTEPVSGAPMGRTGRGELRPRPTTAVPVALADPGRDAAGRRGPPRV
ncbi:hypothetical protein [Micromonospora rhizosphaerae]|uniref:hypothetical protein n=1 Tax=Micromonospora rhizosphaerae TaxID=568872 RepID=UPI00114D16E9|nr:hypothetical protein [Micromonospora rhizosphaerae]